ncbi:MAG: iron-containing alcohol dehydrogenase [Coprobacillus sp.]|nr:iron-containing alcohol dehydrogenase [Coprobacillus sp.]
MPYREPKILKNNGEVAKVLADEKCQRVMIVTDENINQLGLCESLKRELTRNGIEYIIYDHTVANPTTDNVEEALTLFKDHGCSALIAVGGGSPMDCAKAVGARYANPKKDCNQMKGLLHVHHKLPTLVAIPTTAGTGSETTLAAVIVDSKTRHKYAINDFHLIPNYAVLDYKYTINLPKHITSTTGMDALTHAVESFIGRSTTRKTRQEALEATKLIFANLPVVYNEPTNKEARQNMLEASYLAGLAFTKSYVGYVHAIAHSLGGKYDIPHGYANAIILPYVLKMYGGKINKKLYQLGVYANLFSKDTPLSEAGPLFIKAIEELNASMDIPTKIKEIKEEDISELSKTAIKEANPLYPVPVLKDAQQLSEIYYQIKE